MGFDRAPARPSLVLLAVPLLALGGCLQADTLADQPPTTVTIAGTPTWSNGIAALVALKCAVCHQLPRPEIAPNTTPPDLDLRIQTESGTTRGAETIAGHIAAGILRQPVHNSRRMPLDYATPLVASEMTALETWAAAVTTPAVSGTTVADGAILYTFYCQGCHGIGGANGKDSDIQGADVATIDQSLACNASFNGCVMHNWPSLAPLLSSSDAAAVAQKTAISNFLQQFP